MQPEIRFTPFEYTSPKSQNGYDCLRVNFDYADAELKAKLKALGMRWAPEGKYFLLHGCRGQIRCRMGNPLAGRPRRFIFTASVGNPSFDFRAAS